MKMKVKTSSDNQERRATAQERAAVVLKRAHLKESDSATNALRKLDAAMSNEFGNNYVTKLKPMGIVLSEKVKLPKDPKIPSGTASGTVKCKTLIPPTGCSPDVDF